MGPETDAMTAEDLVRVPRDQRCELIEGEIIMMSPAGSLHGQIAANVLAILHAHVKSHDLGVTFAAETGFFIRRDPDTVRAPDVAFVARDRLVNVDRGFYPGPPSLAVEVASPDDKDSDLRAKARGWLDAGSQMVWIVWPDTRTVTVLSPDGGEWHLEEKDSLRGGPLLGGFTCPVRDFFA